MNINTFSATKAAEEMLTMAEKGILSAKVVLTGFVVVFSVLIFEVSYLDNVNKSVLKNIILYIVRGI